MESILWCQSQTRRCFYSINDFQRCRLHQASASAEVRLHQKPQLIHPEREAKNPDDQEEPKKRKMTKGKRNTEVQVPRKVVRWKERLEASNSNICSVTTYMNVHTQILASQHNSIDQQSCRNWSATAAAAAASTRLTISQN